MPFRGILYTSLIMPIPKRAASSDLMFNPHCAGTKPSPPKYVRPLAPVVAISLCREHRSGGVFEASI
jgi:hypothetical protein